MSTSSLLTAVIVCYFFSFSIGDDNCRWRFDDCYQIANDSQCVVRMRLWCGCGENASCATNSTREANTTAARSVLTAVDSNCNVSSCAVVPRQCEWTQWTVYFETCMLTLRRRFRHPCCHPVSRRRLNSSHTESCNEKPLRRVDTKLRTDTDCFSVESPRDPVSEGGKEDDKDYTFVWIALVLVGLLILGMCLRQTSIKKNESGGSLPPPPAPCHEVPSRPTTIIIPEPGWPLSEAQPFTK